jgi:hypothetical protein
VRGLRSSAPAGAASRSVSRTSPEDALVKNERDAGKLREVWRGEENLFYSRMKSMAKCGEWGKAGSQQSGVSCRDPLRSGNRRSA